ncbi:hypothetical protein [Bradyrhizobium sp. USDA 3650]
MPTYSTRGIKVYLVGPDEITEIVNGGSNDYQPSKKAPVIVCVRTGLRQREVADILTDLVKHIRQSTKNARASRAKGVRREKIYMDLS